MALSKHESDRELSNLARIARIIFGPCTDILRDVLKSKITLSDLRRKVFYTRGIHRYDELTVYFRRIFSELAENYSNLGIPQLYISLRVFCNIPSHENKWGNFPDKKDRSLSANIERIYYISKKYRQFPTEDLHNSIFEQEWESVLQTVKELEEHLGPGTEHRDTLNRLKICSMEKDVKRIFIEKLRSQRTMDRAYGSSDYLEFETNLKGPGDLSKPKFLSEFEEEDLYLDSESEDDDVLAQRTMDWAYGSSDYLEFETNLKGPGDLSKTKFLSEFEDKPHERTEPIASKDLTELFTSFNIEFPDDPLKESFARGMLQHCTVDLLCLIQSLSTGVRLTNKISRFQSFSHKAMMFEIDVVYEGGQFRVLKKDKSANAFEDFAEKSHPVKIILISSKSIPVVKAKLMVYQKYRHAINAKKIFLQHEYEDFDDVAKMIAYHHLEAFCKLIESVINLFTTDLYQRITAHADKTLTGTKIRELCLKVLRASFPKFLVSGILLSDWTNLVEKILKQLSTKGNLIFICTDAWDAIWSICRKTVEDLGVILSGLEEFGNRVIPLDQDKHVAEWEKREVIRNKSLLREYPSILKYIAGHNGDGKDVVKVYLSDDNEEAKEFLRKECRKVLDDPDFKFVNVEKPNEISEENEEFELEEEVSTSDDSGRMELLQIIQKYEPKIYARYSSVIGIQIGNVSRVDDPMQEDLGVILYCLDKTLIPFGETPLPKYLAGWPCDVKEDFFILGACPNQCSAPYQNLPEPGCNIGIPYDDCYGSAGFLYESNSRGNTYGSGFITASHVAIKQFLELYLENKPLSNHNLRRQRNVIVHPSYNGNNKSNNEVGHVVESFCGEYGDPPTGLDFAVVKNDFSRPKEFGNLEKLNIVKETELNFEKIIKVKKTGSTTGPTEGYLIGFKIHGILSARIDPIPDSEVIFLFPKPYVVHDKYKNKPFFREGDSGAGVYVVEENLTERPLGIAFGYSFNKPYTFVCNIEKILRELDLTLVRYHQDVWGWSPTD